jgi:lipoprotein-anchoring transpeptidase ErfK/SrfK
MRRLILAVVVLFVVLAGASVAAAWRYDKSRSDRLADGIEIAGIDLGGMRVAQARAVLADRVAEPLARPIAARYHGGQFVFSPVEADVRTNVDELLGNAVAESRGGNFLSRALREVSGGRVEVQASPDIDYSHRAVERFVRKIERVVDRRPHDAKSSASFAGVRIKPSRTGVAVEGEGLRLRIESLLVDPYQPRSFKLPTHVLRPKVTTAALKKRFHVFLAVSRSKKQLRYFVKENLVKTYRVAIGRIGFETPAGLYEIRTKTINPAWFVPKEAWAGDLAGKIIPPGDPENPLKARWMGFWDGAGIHGTAEISSIGTAASHGCIRMTVHDVIQLYNRVPLPTPISIS